MNGTPIETARVLVEAGVREALRDVGDRRVDVSPLVDAVILRLLAADERAQQERRRAAHERSKAKDPDGYRAKNLEAVKRSRAKRRGAT